MKHLQFLRRYKDALLSGEKKLTIRTTKPNLRKGDTFIAHCGGRVIGKFKVIDIYLKKIKDITEEEAKLDGFSSKEELLRELRSYYRGLNENKEVVIIKFEPLEIFKDEISSEDFAWGGRKIDPVELAKLLLEKDDRLTEKHREYLEILIKEGSIRKAAIKLGGLNKRGIFRKILREGFIRLKRKGII
ncbi:ASCH domain-containing protein [Nanoarchaeota archaeon NZ13-N]|uniref:ASCH domain-containing protein n=1 Tax=Candidatus Nanoclepta minutus TaxID=1940235 RepID=A0A397WPE7_9ARCH|nr:MAG: ASCH domain-containing protein [Nanoarchaeota archaeon NZ13-N]RIB35379.1 MAG: hypothetical protein BXU00_01275 [Candidatus Nanoclepta minutus]